MTKQKLIHLIVCVIVIICLGICVFFTQRIAKAVNPKTEKIAELTFQLYELEFQKRNCLDNLSRKQSEAEFQGFTKYCVEFDEQMMLIQEQIDELTERKDEYEVQEEETESFDDSLNCPVELYEKYERDCVNHLEDDWKPGKISEDGTHQEMPVLTGSDSHERFKELSSKYGLDPSLIRTVENHYGIKEGVILCITIAETSGCKNGAGEGNCGNVGNNDRGDRQSFATIQTSIEKIGMTLNNGLLGNKQTLGCLSNWNHCQEPRDNGKRYATSSPGIGHREPNMVACLEKIYGEGTIDPATFNIRR